MNRIHILIAFLIASFVWFGVVVAGYSFGTDEAGIGYYFGIGIAAMYLVIVIIAESESRK